jgi:hypothetical protein
VARSDAMLAYVAVTRAREQLDHAGLRWVDSYAASTAAAAITTRKEARKEKAMSEITAEPADPLPATEAGEPRPYAGGRAQAESASLIIRNDYDAWTTTAGGPDPLPADHPRVQQFAWAWRAVAKRGLDDEAGLRGSATTSCRTQPVLSPMPPAPRAGAPRAPRCPGSLSTHCSMPGGCGPPPTDASCDPPRPDRTTAGSRRQRKDRRSSRRTTTPGPAPWPRAWL